MKDCRIHNPWQLLGHNLNALGLMPKCHQVASLWCNATAVTLLCYWNATATFMTQGFMVAERKVAQKKDRYITKSEALCNRLSEA